jgi:hypothetical protein
MGIGFRFPVIADRLLCHAEKYVKWPMATHSASMPRSPSNATKLTSPPVAAVDFIVGGRSVGPSSSASSRCGKLCAVTSRGVWCSSPPGRGENSCMPGVFASPSTTVNTWVARSVLMRT